MLTIILAHPESNPDGKREFKIDKNTQCLKFLFQKKVKYNILLKLSKNEDIYFFKPYFLLKSKREFFILILLFFHDGDLYHMDTSPLTCFANHWSGFFMIGSSAMKELKRRIYGLLTKLSTDMDEVTFL